MNKKIFSFLQEAAARWQNKTAIVHQDLSTTYVELLKDSQALAASLKRFGDFDGRGIAFMCSNGAQFVSGLFGCSLAGGVVMPMLPGTKSSEIENLLSESSINVLLVEKGSELDFKNDCEKIKVNDDFTLYVFKGISPQNIATIFPDAAFIRPSSGTTGDSKGVVISHQAVFERTEAANDGLKLNAEHSMLWVLPMAFHFIVSILLYIRYGVTMIVSENFLAGSILEIANKYKATHLYASPLHYRLLASDTSNLQFETLATPISTSAKLEEVVSKKFFERFNLPVVQAYGIIEIGLPFINLSDTKNFDSIGKAVPTYDVAILDEKLNELPFNAQGAFAIKGAGMFSGYLFPLKRIEEVLVKGWFLTGDIATMDANGFVYIKGRSKSMINVAGTKVFPEEVESVLKLYSDIEDARVFGGTHPFTGELVEAEIVLKQGAENNTEAIITHCKLYLVSYKIPQRLFFVDAIQKTNTGKTKRS